MTRSKLLKINPYDQVAVALADLARGESVSLEDGTILTLAEPVAKGHKVALYAISQGDKVLKYGAPIGIATADIRVGEWVHTHNLRTGLEGKITFAYCPVSTDPGIQKNHPGKEQGGPAASTPESRGDYASLTFMGYKRRDGRVGIRNEIWIVNTVGCVNKTAELIAAKANVAYAEKTDGIFAFSHPYGCSQMGDDHETTRKILADMVRHPNCGGVLVLGLGCENNTMDSFKAILGDYDKERVRFLVAQEVDDEIGMGLVLIGELVEKMAGDRRHAAPLSSLAVGLKCGGSDAFSGITANPLLGRFSDLLVEAGGTSLLTEVPEMFGAETLLMNRCIDCGVFDRTVSLINDFKDYYIRHDQVIYDNPSPGNKAGGITTLEEKSLGCTQKGGTSPVTDVLNYGDRIKTPGLNLLKGPGNDIVAETALMAAGAQIILFTTGRGTPLGAPVPTLKVSTQTELFRKKPHWIDFNAGVILEDKSLDQTARELLAYVIKVASGEIKARNEENGYREIAIFKDGVTL